MVSVLESSQNWLFSGIQKKPSGNTIYDRTYDFLPVIRVCIVVVSVRPEPELRVAVNAPKKDLFYLIRFTAMVFLQTNDATYPFKTGYKPRYDPRLLN